MLSCTYPTLETTDLKTIIFKKVNVHKHKRYSSGTMVKRELLAISMKKTQNASMRSDDRSSSGKMGTYQQCNR